MGVASGGQSSLVEATLCACRLLELFDTIVTIEEVRRRKPAPDLFSEAARRLKVQRCERLVFEDSKEGIEGARRAGAEVIDVRLLERGAM